MSSKLIAALRTIRDAFWSDGESPEIRLLDFTGIASEALSDISEMKTRQVNKFPAAFWECTNGRITETASSFYQSGQVSSDTIIIVAECNDDLLGVSAVTFSHDKGWHYAITIVKPEYRNKGVGTALVKHKLLVQKTLRVDTPCIATIASDNFASVRMAMKAGYTVSGSNQPERSNGKYLQLEMTA